MNNRIIHLYPPVSGGVTDYVDVCLAHQPQSTKLLIDVKSIITTNTEDNYLLHYSGYGYAKRGTPLWLPKKIEKQCSNIKKIGIFFHELYAFGPITGSAFWLSPMQRYIARCLVETSDFWITNREESAQWLRKFSGAKPNAVLPVFSNVGEMSFYAKERKPKVVIFGSAILRSKTYRTTGDRLFLWAREQNFELHDVGPVITDSLMSATLRNAGVIQHGRLESNEVSELLSDAMFGILAYSLNYAAKSGVLAAYCAHGICPILISKNYKTSDGLVAGTNYIAGMPIKKIEKNIVRNIGMAAWNWYQPHRIVKHVETFNILCQNTKK
jgi:hypothetical protein